MYKLPRPEPMSELQILEKAHRFWLEYVREVGAEYILNHGFDFNEVYDAVIYPRYEITLVRDEDLGVDDFGDPILGRFLPKENTAFVDKKLFATRDPRTAFTQWHEVGGHGVLQGAYLRKIQDKFNRLYTTEKSIKLSIENNFERQANVFASNIAAPRNFVWCIFIKVFGKRTKIRFFGARKYSLSYLNHNIFVNANSPFELAWKIAKRIQPYFGGLSAEVIAYQLLAVAIDNNGYNKGSFSESKFTQGLASIASSYLGGNW